MYEKGRRNVNRLLQPKTLANMNIKILNQISDKMIFIVSYQKASIPNFATEIFFSNHSNYIFLSKSK